MSHCVCVCVRVCVTVYITVCAGLVSTYLCVFCAPVLTQVYIWPKSFLGMHHSQLPEAVRVCFYACVSVCVCVYV